MRKSREKKYRADFCSIPKLEIASPSRLIAIGDLHSHLHKSIAGLFLRSLSLLSSSWRQLRLPDHRLCHRSLLCLHSFLFRYGLFVSLLISPHVSLLCFSRLLSYGVVFGGVVDFLFLCHSVQTTPSSPPPSIYLAFLVPIFAVFKPPILPLSVTIPCGRPGTVFPCVIEQD